MTTPTEHAAQELYALLDDELKELNKHLVEDDREYYMPYMAVYTPELDRHNDHITLYVEILSFTEGAFIITDLGDTLEDRELCGLETDKKEICEIMQRHAVFLDGEKIHRTILKTLLNDTVRELAKACAEISNLEG